MKPESIDIGQLKIPTEQNSILIIYFLAHNRPTILAIEKV